MGRQTHHTKAPEVTLYLNGKQIGKKNVDLSTEFKAVFSVPYEAGTLRAVAGGKSVTLTTAGEPARLRLTAEKPALTADGQDFKTVSLRLHPA